MSISQAVKHWQTYPRTVRKWADEIGGGLIEAMEENGRFASKQAGRRTGRIRVTVATVAEDPIDQRAMRHLQRTTRWVCYSSRIYGASGDVYYHVGNRRVSLGELLEIAAEHGFQP
jgi:hypothetical protein